MASLNVVTLIGHVGRDPELRTLNGGDRVCNLSLAMSESWRDKQSGERKERTEWANVVVWGEGLVKVFENYVHKGSKVYVSGQLRTRKWEKDGQTHYATEVVLQGPSAKVVLLDSKRDGEDEGQRSGASENQSRHTRSGGGGEPAGYAGGAAGFSADLDDEIPF